MIKHRTKIHIIVLFLFLSVFLSRAQQPGIQLPDSGYIERIREYVDTLRIIDTHEHLFTPELIRNSYFLDFMLLFQQNSYNDLLSAGMPEDLFEPLFNEQLTPVQKWKIIEPYWQRSFNTTFNRIILLSVRKLYDIDDLNDSTVTLLSDKIKIAYNSDWFDIILRDSCRIDYVIQDGYQQTGKDQYFRYVKRFDDWLLVRSKFRIDSLAINQMDPIFTLEDYVKSMRLAFENAVNNGMRAVKIFISYSRTLSVDKIETEAARKVFRGLVNGDEDHAISMQAAKPLQDYMIYQLLDLAKKYKLPVAIHSGLQAGTGNIIGNSNPVLLVSIFNAFPDINFILFHGSYPFGGELSALAKNFNNVYIDMNWSYAISPSYSERFLNEWLETVPAGKLMAFGGDFMVPEDVYGELMFARNIISNVLINKVTDGYLTETEAKNIARMILHDNAAKLYRLD